MDSFLQGYLECALWSSLDFTDDDDCEPVSLDQEHSIEDFSLNALHEAMTDCNLFQEQNAADLANIEPAQAGRDFWLTRNRHGAGFWDRNLGEVGEQLTKAAHAYGEVNLYACDGKVCS